MHNLPHSARGVQTLSLCLGGRGRGIRRRLPAQGRVWSEVQPRNRGEIKRIVDTIEEVLGENPEAGTALKGQFSGLFRLRVVTYRVIYTRIRDGVLILTIGQRKNIYKRVSVLNPRLSGCVLITLKPISSSAFASSSPSGIKAVMAGPTEDIPVIKEPFFFIRLRVS